MNVSTSLLRVSLVAALATIGLAGQAQASGTIHGSVCKAYSNSAADQAAIFSGSTGTANHDAAVTRSVICPVARRTGSNGVTVWVEGSANNGNAVSCTLTSRYGGVYRGSKSFSTTQSYFDQGMTMNATEAPYWAKLDLVCKLPPKANGTIVGISLND